MRYDDWIDDDEYPSDEDVEDFGYGSPADYDPLTIGYVGDYRPPFWTTRRMILLIVISILIGAMILLSLLG